MDDRGKKWLLIGLLVLAAVATGVNNGLTVWQNVEQACKLLIGCLLAPPGVQQVTSVFGRQGQVAGQVAASTAGLVDQAEQAAVQVLADLTGRPGAS